MEFNGLMYLEAPSDYQIIRWSDNSDMKLPELLILLMEFNGLMYLEAPSDYQIIRWSDNSGMELPETLNIAIGISWINVFRGTIRLSDDQIILIWNYQKLLILLMELYGLMYLEAPSDYQMIK